MELYGGADGALGSRIGVPDRNWVPVSWCPASIAFPETGGGPEVEDDGSKA